MRRKDDAGAFYAFYDDLTKEKLGGFVKKNPRFILPFQKA